MSDKPWQFQKGQVANPNGRPKGVKDKRTLYNEMFEFEAPELIRQAIQMAKEGDAKMMAQCLERILPKAKITPDDYLAPTVDLDLRSVRTQEDVDNFSEWLISQAKNGDLPLHQVERLLNMCKIKLEMSLKIKQDTINEQRMLEIEQKLGIERPVEPVTN